MSEHLLFLNIINVKERCHIREILSNCQTVKSCFFRVGIGFRSQILSTYARVQKPQSGWRIYTEYPLHMNIYFKGTAILLTTDIKTRTYFKTRHRFLIPVQNLQKLVIAGRQK